MTAADPPDTPGTASLLLTRALRVPGTPRAPQPPAGGTGAVLAAPDLDESELAGTGRPAAAWRPWHGRARVRDIACCLCIAVSAVYAIATIPLTPELIASHPMLLEMLSGGNSAIVAAGSFSAVQGKLQLAVVIAAALPGMLRFDWVIWWAGRLWGPKVVERLGSHQPRTTAMIARAERRGTRFARPAVLLSALLPVTGAPVYAAAGWVGLPLVTFVILDAIGCAAWAAVLATCGYLLGARGVAVAGLVARYALASIAVLVVVAVAPHLWQAWRRRAAARAACRAESGAGRPADRGIAGQPRQ
jgi:membrane protein DedA with SNARE-associated domain